MASQDGLVDFRGVSLVHLRKLEDMVINRSFGNDGIDSTKLVVVVKDFDAENANRGKGATGDGFDYTLSLRKGQTLQVTGKVELHPGVYEGYLPYGDKTGRENGTFPSSCVKAKERGDWDTEDYCQYVIKKLTKEAECIYIHHEDVLNQKGVVSPQPFKGAFVSQARRTRFADLLEALERYAKKQSETTKLKAKDFFVWLDMLGANQPVLTSPHHRDQYRLQISDLLSFHLHKAVRGFEHFLIFFDTWNNPKPLQRLWCIWELWGFVNSTNGKERSGDIEIIFTKSQRDAFVDYFAEKRGTVRDIITAWSCIDLGNAQALPHDREFIVETIREQHIGRDERDAFLQIGEKVKQALMETLVSEVKQAIEFEIEKSERRRKPTDPTRKASLHCGLGELFWRLGKFDDASKSYKLAKAIEDVLEEGDNEMELVLARCWHGIGNVLYRTGKYADAAQYLEKSIEIRQRIHGRDHPEIANSLSCLGIAYQRQGKYRKAKRFYMESLEMYKRIHGKRVDHPEIARNLVNLGCIFRKQKKFQQCKRSLMRALEMYKRIYGGNTDHPDIAPTLMNLGKLFNDQSNFEKAERYKKESLEMRKRMYGENSDHPDIATSLMNLGYTYECQSNFENAERCYQECFEMFKRIHREQSNHPDLERSRRNLRRLLRILGRYE